MLKRIDLMSLLVKFFLPLQWPWSVYSVIDYRGVLDPPKIAFY